MRTEQIGEYLVTFDDNDNELHREINRPTVAPHWTDANLDPQYWHIDIGPFFDRFGTAKLAILASSDALVQAIVKDSTVRQYIDLKRADVAQAVGILVSKALLSQPQADALLNTHTTDYERHIKGLVQPV
jgi:hypothetical protein